MAACAPDVSVSKVALAHGLNTNMVFKWRRELRAGLLGSPDSGVLLAVALSAEPAASVNATDPDELKLKPVESTPTRDSHIEIELNGARVRVHGQVDPIQLRLVLRCLMPV